MIQAQQKKKSCVTGFSKFFPWAAANGVIASCAIGWNQNKRTCLQAKQTAVGGLMGSSWLPLSAFYWDSLVASAHTDQDANEKVGTWLNYSSWLW